jgi:hypothetical protein
MTDEKYECPACKVSMSTSIKLTVPPTHKCAKKANRMLPLVLVETKEKTPTK